MARFKLLLRFFKERRGNVAIIFALVLVPITSLTGVGVDYAHFVNRTTQLQSATDAAALEAAKTISVSTFSAGQAAATKMFNANVSSDSYTTVSSFSVTQSGPNVVVSATGQVKTAVLGLIGVTNMPFKVTAQATYAQPWMEIVIVQDITGSMNDNGKLTAAKTAATTMVNTLFADPMIGPKLSMALVPFNTQVNIGTSYSNAWWLRSDNTGLSIDDTNTVDYGLAKTVCSGWGRSYRCSTVTSTWTGCLIDRDSSYDQNNVLPVYGTTASYYRAASCEYATPLTIPLTSSSSTLTTAINNLSANGGTSIPIGFQTAYAMLTPGVPFDVSQSSTRTTKQIIVLLTDGMNSQTSNASVAGVDGRYGDSTLSPDARLSALCTSAKNAGIIVYTVDIVDGNASLLQSCATSPNYFFMVNSSSGIGPALATITAGIQSLRLTQ